MYNPKKNRHFFDYDRVFGFVCHCWEHVSHLFIGAVVMMWVDMYQENMNFEAPMLTFP